MKITITQDFDTPEAAAEFIARIGNPAAVIQQIGQIPPPDFTYTATPGAQSLPTPAAKPRKPRADAGKPRGPHKTTGEPAASEPGTTPQTSSGVTAPAAQVSPTPTAAPAATGEAGTATQAAPTAAVPTHDDAHTALKRLSNTPGKGMDACIAVLKAFGVSRRTELPKEKLAEFIKEVDAQIEAQVKANALAKAAK